MLPSAHNSIKFLRNVQYSAFLAWLFVFPVASLAEPTVNNSSSSSTPIKNQTTSMSTSSPDFTISNIASLVVDVIGMLCNALLILTIIINPLKILHRGAWVTILNLSFADFISCGSNFVIVYFVQVEDHESLGVIAGPMFNFFWLFGVGASFLLLTLLTVQIYLIIKYPMTSRLMLTGKRVALSCGIVWVFAVLLGLSNIAYVWIKTMDALYFYIAQKGFLELAVAFQIVLKILIIIETLGTQEHIVNAQTQNQKEVAKTVVTLNVILIVTAFPFFLAKQIELLARLGHVKGGPLLRKFYYYYEPVALLNFVANPVLYSLRLRDYRRSLLALVKMDCKKRRHASSYSRATTARLNRTSTNLDKTELTRL